MTGGVVRGVSIVARSRGDVVASLTSSRSRSRSSKTLLVIPVSTGRKIVVPVVVLVVVVVFSRPWIFDLEADLSPVRASRALVGPLVLLSLPLSLSASSPPWPLSTGASDNARSEIKAKP